MNSSPMVVKLVVRAGSRREVLSDIGLKPWWVPISHEE